ncbi:hypothetical protein D3C72_1907910 [compost metagenome]
MAHGLAVGADGGDGCRGGAGAGQQLRDHVGIHPRQAVAGQGRAVQFVVAGGVERQQLGAQRGGKVGAGVVDHREVAVVGEIGDDAVDPVERGARHQADEALLRLLRCGGHAWGREAQSALAWITEKAAASSVRAPTAMRSKAGRRAAVIGAPPSCAIVVGSW